MDLPHLQKDKKVVVFGAASLDVVGRPEGIPEPGTSSPAMVRTSYGGVARNVAETLARLGQPTALVTVVGNDSIGRAILRHLDHLDVDISASIKVEDYRTAAYLAVLNEQGDLYFGLDDMNILNCLTPERLRACAGLLADASLVFVDANLPPAALKTIFAMAERANIPVIADATSGAVAPRLEPYISQMYLLTANRSEANALLRSKVEVSGRSSGIQAAREFVRMGAKIAIVPIAEGGVCYATSQIYGHIPAVITQIKDTTGAGDALTGTTIFALLNDLDLDESVRLGVTAASLTLAYPGAVIPGLSLEMLYQNLVI
jgi:pseudouridine kinase